MELFSFISIYLLVFLFKMSTALDTITPSQSMSDGKTLISQDGSFELGFFSAGISKNRYLGIWYKNIPVRTIVWVANRSSPINDSSGLLMIEISGNLLVLSGNKTVVWSSESSKEAQSPILQLLDSGNLVLRDEKESDPGIYLWQSFDYPSDTLLPGMKLGVNLKTGLDRRLTSWKSWDDPSPGDLFWKIQIHNNPESTMWKGSRIFFRTGPWNGITFSGTPQLKPNPIFYFNFVHNEDEVYYTFGLKKKSIISRLVMNQTNNRRDRYTWDEAAQSWSLYTYLPIDYCDTYGLCGAYGNCIISESPVCQCLEGFKPKLPEKWNSGNWSQGCVRNKPLNCQSGDGFIKFRGLKLPDTTYSWVSESMNIKDCRVKCLQNCSCTAYTNLDIRSGGSGCALWFNNLVDIRENPYGGQDLYVRVSASELDVKDETGNKIVIIIIAAIAVASGILIVSYCFCKSRRKFTENHRQNDENNENQNQEMELPIFDIATIAKATDDFSMKNKLGEGGFGPVYKGTLVDGQEIAVKRLSKSSGQGLNEFRNEVILFSKLQHRNLVKLLGCCIQGEERMLIYEYMPNKSLDFFIFDQTRGELLDWSKRFNIICGIARGLLYLHQDSRLRVIHRDLKASNVLIDNEMNPKISDFGMARTFGGDQTEGSTNKVVGTYGYMAPEYATDGLFSVKSDVFSFGILMLEIISGKRSKGFYHPNQSRSLIGHAWSFWKEGKLSELIDPFIGESCNISEVSRCVHISLLCVQQHPVDRPSMASIVLMLNSENTFPQPKQPGFVKDKGLDMADSSSSKLGSSSVTVNEITFSLLEAR
ncbi:hypothetical protein P3X46_006735 [Hevea brasiliensis]|uniref:Receptor-like serine/threonine-protein kinase n=1 Tax=Hevea brasiliensis TaxID=3981 RepID=A0ABQ9MTR3_HEVBR|nr:G-type lectin S-receptor-like serine/threonine-protein kinase At4g27290 isoform X2 [Hevea brasiliensis]KAJ9182780.1 hypothetical protein P3X46_006735 [Hevea brasiliensis]